MKKSKKIVLVAALVLVMMPLVIPAVLAQEPPTWLPPEIYKSANDRKLEVGDPVQFTILVQNPPDSTADGTWYNVRVTDQVDPVLRIDAASSTMGTVTITGQTVVVNGGITLARGDQFVVTIDCTLVGPVTPGQVIINTARLEYTDDEGTPQPPIDVDDPVEIIIEEEVPPVIPEASTLLLLGSGATGLIGYAGLQIRARRRKGS
jgi:fimbrial isopeptide formation D2 family protein